MNTQSISASYVNEPAKPVPVIETTDVLIAGAGPAGIAAAIAAARLGAQVRLIETQGCLGGIWTAGLLCYLIDWRNKSGLMREIVTRLEAAGARGAGGEAFDPEVVKGVLEQLCMEAGVQLLFHTRVVAALRDGRRVTHVITENKSGRQAWKAAIFIDATGDGDLGAQAGCGFDVGRPGKGDCQPMSLIALLEGVEPAEAMPFLCAGTGSHEAAKSALLADLARAGQTPSYARPSLFHIRDTLYALMTNHEYGVSALDAAQITAATIRARAEINVLVGGLRSLGGVWRTVRVVATAGHIGVREGRRIHGHYRLGEEDLARGARFDDGICRATFCVDIHSTDPAAGKGCSVEGRRVQPYDVPLRSLIACDVDGLMMAGRCISGDFFAHASYRVTGNAVAMGEAAGVCAARAARTGCLPQQVPWKDILSALVPV